MAEIYLGVVFQFLNEAGRTCSIPYHADVKFLPRPGDLVDLSHFSELPALQPEFSRGVVTDILHLVCGDRGTDEGAQFVTVFLRQATSPHFPEFSDSEMEAIRKAHVERNALYRQDDRDDYLLK